MIEEQRKVHVQQGQHLASYLRKIVTYLIHQRHLCFIFFASEYLLTDWVFE